MLRSWTTGKRRNWDLDPHAGNGVRGLPVLLHVVEPMPMKKPDPVTCLFLDIGGVLLTNGWGRDYRARAAKAFGLNLAELESRHHLLSDAYEAGKVDLREYLNAVVFYERRQFTLTQFRAFMFAQSAPFAPMIDLVREGLPIV